MRLLFTVFRGTMNNALSVYGGTVTSVAHTSRRPHIMKTGQRKHARSQHRSQWSVPPAAILYGSESRVKTRLHLTRCSLYSKRPYQDSGLLDKSRSSARLATGCNSAVYNSLRTASLWKHTYSRALALRRPRLFGLGPALTFGFVTMFSRHCRRCASRLTWLGSQLWG